MYHVSHYQGKYCLMCLYDLFYYWDIPDKDPVHSSTSSRSSVLQVKLMGWLFSSSFKFYVIHDTVQPHFTQKCSSNCYETEKWDEKIWIKWFGENAKNNLIATALARWMTWPNPTLLGYKSKFWYKLWVFPLLPFYGNYWTFKKYSEFKQDFKLFSTNVQPTFYLSSYFLIKPKWDKRQTVQITV